MSQTKRVTPLPTSEALRTALGGLVATGLTTAASVALNRTGLMRLDFGRLLGTLVAPDSAKTRALGWTLHTANGVAFAYVYRAAFRRLGMFSGTPAGLTVGVPHAAGAMALVAALRYTHPHAKAAGLTELSPRAYGPLTVPALVLGHVLYGAIVGSFVGAERRERFTSARFLSWLKRQEEDDRSGANGSGLREPVQLSVRRRTPSAAQRRETATTLAA